MYFTSVNITNVRCFESLSVELNYPGKDVEHPVAMPNINLLLGNNGRGKSTLLKSLALAALGPIIASSGYVPYSMIRKSTSKAVRRSASIEVDALLHQQDTGAKHASGKEIRNTLGVRLEGIRDVERIDLEGGAAFPYLEAMSDNSSPAFFVVGYGASRRVESGARFDMGARSKTRLLRYQRVAGLFEEHMTLVPLAAWLPQLKSKNPGRHKQVVNLMNRLLPDGTRLLDTPKDGEYYFEHSGISVPFGALSDGYRSFIGWVADLLHHICMGCPSGKKLVDNAGVVLVDEVDLHLHPEWQRVVVPTLSKVLPNLQFVLTTHSPIVVGTLEKVNIFYFDAEPKGPSSVRQPDEETLGLNAEQILVGEAFGLESTRSERFLVKLEQVSDAAQKGKKGASRLFARMLSHGAGALNSPEEPELELPAWVEKSRALLQGANGAGGGDKSPIVKKSAAKKPVAKKPVAKKPVAKKSAAKKSAAKKVAAKKPVAKKSAAKKSAAKKPAAKK